MIIAILEALIAIPKIAGIVQGMISQVVYWWILKQKTDVLAAIADAAAMTAMAESDEDRFQAAATWQAVLKKSRASA